MQALGTAAAGITLTAAAVASTAAAAPVRHSFVTAPLGGRLYGVAATSPRNAWAVGLTGTRSLIAHWNGTDWTQELSSRGFLRGTAATSRPSAWAVGGTDWFSPQTLIEHWDGHAWRRVPSPSPAPGGYLNGVAGTSPGNAWAAGLIGGGPGTGTGPTDKTLIEHWDGHAWTQVPSPTPQPAGGLNGVAATSPANAWAVGWTGTGPDFGGTSRALIEHWDGNAWTRVPSPGNAPGARTVLNAVAAISPRNAWAVGSTHLGAANRAFIVHWDGTAWQRVHAPTPVPGVSLLGVAVTSPRNAWAVGQTAFKGACGPTCATVIERWDGSAWTLVPSPNPPSIVVNVLLGVAAVSPRNAWAVGTTDYQSTLIVRWNGQAWK
jgi:hypothetical protein